MDLSKLVQSIASTIQPQQPVAVPSQTPVNTRMMSSVYQNGGQEKAMFDLINQQNNQTQDELNNLYDNPVIDPMAYSDYYPNQQKSINVGSYSGQTFSAPIFASAGVMPMARYDAFQKARYDSKQKQLEDAAAASQGIFEKLAPPELKDPFAQQKFNDQFYKDVDGYVQKYMKAYPQNWQSMLQQSPEFNRLLKNYNVLGKAADQLTNDIAKTETDVSTGDLILSKQGQMALDHLKGGISSLGSGDFSMHDLQGAHNILQGEKSLNFIMENSGVLEKAKAHIEDVISKYAKGQGTDAYQIETKKDFDQFATNMTEELFRGALANSKVYKPKQVKEMILSYLGSESTKKLQAIDNGGLTAYQKGALGIEWQKLKDAKETGALSNQLYQRMQTVLAAKHGAQVGTGVGSSAFGSKSIAERMSYIDPKDINMTEDQIKAKYPWLGIDDVAPAAFKKLIGHTFIVVDLADGTSVPMDNSDPDFPMKYNAYLSGNDEGEGVKINDDEFKAGYDMIAAGTGTKNPSGQSTTTYTSLINANGTHTKQQLLDSGYSEDLINASIKAGTLKLK